MRGHKATQASDRKSSTHIVNDRSVAVVLLMVGVIVTCGSSDPTEPKHGGSDAVPISDSVVHATTTVPTSLSTEGPGTAVDISYRVLTDGASVGGVWTTELANTDVEWKALWADLNLTGKPPVVSFDSSVVIYFAPAESSSCPYGPLEAVQYDPITGRLYPVLPINAQRDAEGLFECTADANPHAVLVAIDRADLPSGPFDIWVDNSDPPQCCGGEVTPIGAGELKSPPPNQ